MPRSTSPTKSKKGGKNKKSKGNHGAGASNSKPPPANKTRVQKQKSRSGPPSSTTAPSTSTNLSGSERVAPPSKTLILIWLLVGGELALDLFSTVVAFIAMLNDFNCCGEVVELGGLPLGITLPFFLLIVLEIVMLLLSIKYHLTRSHAEAARDEAARKADTSVCNFLGHTTKQRLMNGLLVLNPFFGFLVAWLLLYQSNKKECFIVLGFEAGSLVLHWLSIYFEGNPQTKLSLAFHAIPIIPFLATVIVIAVSLNQGGVCYLVEQEYFWYKGCQICSDGTPLGQDGNDECPEGGDGTFGSYCGLEESFCFFKY